MWLWGLIPSVSNDSWEKWTLATLVSRSAVDEDVEVDTKSSHTMVKWHSRASCTLLFNEIWLLGKLNVNQMVTIKASSVFSSKSHIITSPHSNAADRPAPRHPILACLRLAARKPRRCLFCTSLPALTFEGQTSLLLSVRLWTPNSIRGRRWIFSILPLCRIAVSICCVCCCTVIILTKEGFFFPTHFFLPLITSLENQWFLNNSWWK